MKRKISIKIIALISCVCLLLSTVGCRGAQGVFGTHGSFGAGDIPPVEGDVAYAVINGNVPFFTEGEKTMRNFESYSPLDSLGRSGSAFACISPQTMPTGQRGQIGDAYPSGWDWLGTPNNRQYDFIEDGYLYNRCHLIGYQLAGENSNPKNLITGTRFFNIQGMLPFENSVAQHVKTTGGSVLYRVTPIYRGLNALCEGVLMEAWSVEDGGESICFCIFAFNLQPGVYINYVTGENYPR